MRLLFVTFFTLTAAGCGFGAAAGFHGLPGAGGASGAGGGPSAGGSTTTSTIEITSSSGGAAGGAGGATTTGTPSASSSTSSSSSSTGTWSTSGGGGDGGLPAASGDCLTDADCPSGHCAPITPGGFRVCLVPPTPATTCTSGADQCCPGTMPCAGGAPCYEGPLVPVCSGVSTAPHNACGVDQCAKDVDCAAEQICAPAGALGLEIRACATAMCRVDTDCTAHPGGICAPVQAPCCSASAGLFCVYPNDGGCRKNADCTAPQTYCAPDLDTGAASCQPGSPLCPA